MDDLTVQPQIQPPTRSHFTDIPGRQSRSSSFGEVLEQSLDSVNRLQREAEEGINNLATGKHTDIHQTMIAAEKASVSFELLMQIRNKVITAYDRLMRTQV